MSTPICEITPFRRGLLTSDLERVVDLWNASLKQDHGFFPLDAALFAKRVLKSGRFARRNLLLARDGHSLLGLVHVDRVHEPYYEPAGVVEMLLVAPQARGQGVGRALLAAALERFQAWHTRLVDGFGSWPYTPFYTTLIDGSERSGVFLNDVDRLQLFEAQGFVRTRASLVMHCHLSRNLPPLSTTREAAAASTRSVCRQRRAAGTWLDFVFRGWDLHEHFLFGANDAALSRAIFARMTGWSDHCGREAYALFGVNTADVHRGQGWATINLHRLLRHLGEQGVDLVELHVYADNEPAVRLYRRLGFNVVARTTSFRWHADGTPIS